MAEIIIARLIYDNRGGEVPLRFLRIHDAAREGVQVVERNVWLCATIDGMAVGIAGLTFGQSRHRIGSVFVIPEYRGKGIAQKMVGQMITEHDKDLSAFCFPISQHIFAKFGFEYASDRDAGNKSRFMIRRFCYGSKRP